VRRGQRGFTLVEVLLALAIVGALVVIAFSGVRIALGSWRQGEDRAEAYQHLRGIALTLARTVGAAYPYNGPRSDMPTAVLLFAGTASSLEFVTQAAPYPTGTPAAFTAVVIELATTGERRGLVIRQRLLPNRNPFTEATIVFNDPTLTELSFSYLDDNGAWQDTWEVETEKHLPKAIRIGVSGTLNGRTQALLPLTVPLRVGTTEPQG
jgi:prepilin-type N-terminal cleavage/methylation domain-containing protein